MQELEIIVREIIGTEQSKIIGQIVHKLNRKPFVRNGQQCIGGIRKREGIFKDAHFTSFIGCISMLLVPYMDSKPIDLPEIVRTSNEIQLANVAPKCPGEVNQCQFNKDSSPSSSDAVYLQFDLDKYPEREEETIGISFVTANPNGILFYKSESRRSKNTGILLELKERRLQLTYYEGDSSYTIPFVDKKQYSDNKLHNVYLIKHKSMILLRVDDQLVATSDKSAEANEQDQKIPITSNSLYIAGIPESERSLLNEESFNNFEGCILQVIYNNNEIKFKEATNPRSSNKISFAKCYKPVVRSALLNIPGYKQLQALIVNLKQVKNKQQQQQQLIETTLSQEVNTEEDQTTSNEKQPPVKDIEECALSKQYDSSQLRPVGLRFGLSKNSRLEVHDSFAVKITTFVSFKFRTLQSEGLMFYASDAQNNDFISIWLQDGYVNYAFDCGSGFMHVKSKKTYSDGRYHTVSIVRDKQNGVLTLSDRTNTTVVETIADKSIGEASALSIVEPYYFGSIPEIDKNSLPAAQSDLIITEPFVGCMSDFIIAYKPLKNKIEKIDLMNCSNNHESGLFFTGVSLTSHASLSNYLTLKDTFEINFEIKSRTKNGVILYAGGDENNNDYVLLELNNGELNYKWNADGMTNLVKFTPKLARNELCNSSWIRIKLRKEDKGRIMLEIKGNQIINNFNKEITVKNDLVNIYLGALPVRSAYAEISQTNEPFIGCIRDLAIKKNNGLYANNKALLGMDLQDGVLNYCPLK
jgi:laminin, alpha 4